MPETITLTRSKVFYLKGSILKFVQGVWNVTGASNIAYMLAGDIHLMVLSNNMCIYLPISL